MSAVTRDATIAEMICNGNVRLCEEEVAGRYCYQHPTTRGADRIDRCSDHAHLAPCNARGNTPQSPPPVT